MSRYYLLNSAPKIPGGNLGKSPNSFPLKKISTYAFSVYSPRDDFISPHLIETLPTGQYRSDEMVKPEYRSAKSLSLR